MDEISIKNLQKAANEILMATEINDEIKEELRAVIRIGNLNLIQETIALIKAKTIVNNEIEMKFLVDDLPTDLNDPIEITQGYIIWGKHECRLRKEEYTSVNMKTGDVEKTVKCTLTEKSISKIDGDAVVREEKTREIGINLCEELFNRIIPGTAIVKKTRYRIPIDQERIVNGSTLFEHFIAELDIYDGVLKGLITVEVEFANIDQANNFVFPDWFDDDLTKDRTYSNRELANLTTKDKAIEVLGIEQEIESKSEEHQKTKIEKRFLVDSQVKSLNLSALEHSIITQTFQDALNRELYVCKEVVIKNNPKNGKVEETTKYTSTAKFNERIVDGALVSDEYTIPLTTNDYMISSNKIKGIEVKKTRYKVYADDDLSIVLDVYGGLLGDASLIIAEVSFNKLSAARYFKPLEWFGKEITDDERYRISELAECIKPEMIKERLADYDVDGHIKG